MAKIVVTKKWANENRDFVIYNYLAEKKTVTLEETKEELQRRYDIILTDKEIRQILSDYVKKGVLRPGVRNYKFVPC